MCAFISQGGEAITSPAHPQQLIFVFLPSIPLTTWEKPAEVRPVFTNARRGGAGFVSGAQLQLLVLILTG